MEIRKNVRLLIFKIMPSLKRQCKIAMPGSRGLKAGGSSVIKGLSLAVNVFF